MISKQMLPESNVEGACDVTWSCDLVAFYFWTCDVFTGISRNKRAFLRTYKLTNVYRHLEKQKGLPQGIKVLS